MTHHAAGTEARTADVHRGLCWCRWRGYAHDGVMAQALARWDAERHVAASAQDSSEPLARL